MKILILCFLSYLGIGLAWAQSDCERIIKNMGPGWQKSTVQVPRDWDQIDNGKTLQVSFYHKDQTRFNAKVPIIFFNGGPAMSSSGSINMFDRIEKLRDENLIILDQRGTGCSTNFEKFSGRNIEVFKRYASDSIVKDAELVRQYLFGNKKWKIFGQSYGGLISFRYLELFPNSIHSAHIHGFGWSANPEELLDKREKSIKELTPKFLQFRHSKISQYSIGELIEMIKNAKGRGRVLFESQCLTTPYSLVKSFCGDDIFTGLFMVSGFKNSWSTALRYLQSFWYFMQNENAEELKSYFERFANIYILRFNGRDQAAALHAITYYEIFPDHLLYDGCVAGTKENDLISECRLGRKFIPRLPERPRFNSNMVKLEVVRENIKSFQIPIYYYAGVYDSFLPVQLLQDTARSLDIESSLIIFEKSGHEGFYTEPMLIENLVR